MFLELAERADPIEDIVDEAELITDDDDDGSTIMNIDYIIIQRTLLYTLNEYHYEFYHFDFIYKRILNQIIY